jgi:hypothetical protein
MRLLAFLFFAFPVIVYAQADTTSNFLSRLYFPFDFGYSFTSNGSIRGGGIVKTGLEYRITKTKGFFARFNFDNRSFRYKTQENTLTNITEGSMRFTDYLSGPGYRIEHTKLKLFGLLQAGATIYQYPVVYGTGANLTLTDSHKTSAITKVTLGFEYYIAKNAAVTVETAYLTLPIRSEFWGTSFSSGTISVGFTTTLF